MTELHRSRCRLCRRSGGPFDEAGCCPKCTQQDTRKYVVHPLPASFGSSRFPAHKKGDTSCPSCAHEADLLAQLREARGKLEAVEAVIYDEDDELAHEGDFRPHYDDSDFECRRCRIDRILHPQEAE